MRLINACARIAYALTGVLEGPERNLTRVLVELIEQINMAAKHSESAVRAG